MKIYWFTATNFGDQDVDNVENKSDLVRLVRSEEFFIC